MTALLKYVHYVYVKNYALILANLQENLKPSHYFMSILMVMISDGLSAFKHRVIFSRLNSGPIFFDSSFAGVSIRA